jgi:hypothetical protein
VAKLPLDFRLALFNDFKTYKIQYKYNKDKVKSVLSKFLAPKIAKFHHSKVSSGTCHLWALCAEVKA